MRGHHIGAHTVEPHAVDQRRVGGQAKEPGPWIAGLRARCDRPHFHVTTPQPPPRAHGLRVLVETRCEPDWRGKIDAKRAGPQARIVDLEHGPGQMRAPAQTLPERQGREHADMRIFRILAEQHGLGEFLVQRGEGHGVIQQPGGRGRQGPSMQRPPWQVTANGDFSWAMRAAFT